MFHILSTAGEERGVGLRALVGKYPDIPEVRLRANVAHIRQLLPDHGLGFQVRRHLEFGRWTFKVGL